MDKQKIFDLVVEHAKTMTRVAFVDGACAYRSPTGPCLIGALIKDEHYLDVIEGKTAEHNYVIKALNQSGFKIDRDDVEARDFLQTLQACHDQICDKLKGAAFKATLMKRLKDFAAIEKLEFNV